MNAPIRLYWAGWETDTFSLAKQGWQISAEQNVMNNRMRIAIRHPEAEIQGITEIEEFLYREMTDGRMHSPVIPTTLQFSTLQRQVFVNTMSHSGEFDFRAIDPRPRYEYMSEIRNLEDFAHFETTFETPKHEVYLHEANLNQILEMAIKKQEPEQKQIRKEMLKRKELEEYRRGKLHTELRLVV